MKQKIIETVLSSKIFLFFSAPLIRYLMYLGVLSVWKGVYKNWDEAPGDDNVFEGKIWINKVTERAQKALAVYRSKETISLAGLTQDYILPVAGGMLLPPIKDNLCVLDFGGGMGASYFPLISSIPNPEKVEFHVVEGKTICERGKNIFKDFTRLHFHEQLPKLNKKIDIVHAGSSIQYVPDWQGLLVNFINYHPRLLVLEDLMAGSIPSFITTQNYYGKNIRSWFLNINELIEEVEALGYHLVYKSRYTHKIINKTGPLPMKNFPMRYRLNYGSHLIFERVKL